MNEWAKISLERKRWEADHRVLAHLAKEEDFLWRLRSHKRSQAVKHHDPFVHLDHSGSCEENRLKKDKSKVRETGRGTIVRVQARNDVKICTAACRYGAEDRSNTATTELAKYEAWRKEINQGQFQVSGHLGNQCYHFSKIGKIRRKDLRGKNPST